MIPSKEMMIKALEERHGKERQDKFSSATVAVCGLGGLGSNIAVSLVRAGIGKLILIDFDKVDITNLNRQQYKADQIGLEKTVALSENLKEISPYVELEAHSVFLDENNIPELLQSADVICEAFDKPECKATLVNTVLENMPEKPLVAASGMAGFGDPNTITTKKIMKNFYLCGDGVSDVEKGIGLVAPRVMLCASHQALTVLRILANETDI